MKTPENKCCKKCFQRDPFNTDYCLNGTCPCHTTPEQPERYGDESLKYCEACLQMTNHVNPNCLKCYAKASTSEPNRPQESWSKDVETWCKVYVSDIDVKMASQSLYHLIMAARKEALQEAMAVIKIEFRLWIGDENKKLYPDIINKLTELSK